MRAILIAVLLAGACGHNPPPPVEDRDTSGGLPESTAPATPPNGTMITPDKMDEISRDLARKRETVSRCLAPIVDAHELPRNARGKITLEIVIDGGHARDVKVVSASLDNKGLTDCAIGKVKEIQFPPTDGPYETSYTYEFEAI